MRCENCPCSLTAALPGDQQASASDSSHVGMPHQESVSTPRSAKEGEDQLRNISSIERRSQTPMEDAKSRPACVQVRSIIGRELQPDVCSIKDQWNTLLRCALQEDSYAYSMDQ